MKCLFIQNNTNSVYISILISVSPFEYLHFSRDMELLSAYGIPVSYTHLDVYKRQVYNRNKKQPPTNTKTKFLIFCTCHLINVLNFDYNIVYVYYQGFMELNYKSHMMFIMSVQLTHPRADCLAAWAHGFKRKIICNSDERQARPTKNKRVHITLIVSM